MTTLTDHFTLSNGIEIPSIGFGTWQIPDGSDAYDSVAAALAAGYRHIDTAAAYGNEGSVGRAIADSGIARDDIFVTTKLPAQIKRYVDAVDAFEKSVADLGTDYVDLYLIHAPWPWSEQGADYAAGNAEVWRAFEEFYEAGRIRSIGVSNFSVTDLEKITAASRIAPQVNQIQYYIGNTKDDVVEYCKANDILVEAYSPLATGAILDNAEVRAIADTYDKTVAQLSIRYVVQKGHLPLPKTTTPSRMAENADVDFEISDDDVAALDRLTDTAK